MTKKGKSRLSIQDWKVIENIIIPCAYCDITVARNVENYTITQKKNVFEQCIFYIDLHIYDNHPDKIFFKYNKETGEVINDEGKTILKK